MVFIYYATFLFLVGLAISTTINFDNILYQYSLVCGSQHCSNVSQGLPDTRGFINPCPVCQCDDQCFTRSDCCPDKFFTLNLECTDTTITNYYTKELASNIGDSFIMRSTCPDNTNSTIEYNCQRQMSLSEKLQYLPVMSSLTNMTYRNIFCAQCYNDSSDVVSFEFFSVCEEFVDFNFVSSIDEFTEMIKVKKCRFDAFTTNPSVRICNTIPGKDIVKTCNSTGTWQVYDKDIEWACKNYDNGNNFHVFKNVFCYMCNPPLEIDRVIESCNVTGKWNTYEPFLEEACISQNKARTTFPYKNIYCYFCNVEASNRTFTTYYDASVFIKEELTDDTYFSYTFEIEKINNDYFFELFNDQNNTYNYILNQPPQRIPETVNLTSIYEYYYAMTGSGHFCKNVSDLVSTEDNRFCSCNDTCHFEYEYPCCIDIAFNYSTTCISVENERYLMYDDCENIMKGYELVSNKCLTTNSTDIFTFLPVYNISTFADYKNIYCGVCKTLKYSEQNDSRPNVTEFKPWPFSMICKTALPVQYQLYLTELYQLAIETECNISLMLPPDCHGRKCNEYNSRSNENSDLSWACKNFAAVPFNTEYYYKFSTSPVADQSNVFCTMNDLSSITFVRSPIGYCNVTGEWDAYDHEMKTKCEQLPTIAYHWPYKNIFCKMCNENFIKYSNTYKGAYYCEYGPGFGGIDSPFRTLFSVSRFDDDTTSSVSRNCLPNQIYDSIKETCRNIVCYPGRILRNGTCELLIKSTSNLGYILSFGADLYHNFTIKNPNLFLYILRDILKEKLESYINTYPLVELLILKSNRTCFSTENWDESWNASTSHISVFMRMFISDVIDRDLVEKKLVRFQDDNFTFQYDKYQEDMFPVTIKLGFDASAFLLPVSVNLERFSDRSCVSREGNPDDNAAKFIHSHVNSLLRCTQIELDTTEFMISNDRLKLEVPAYSAVLNYSQFYLTQSRTIRICLNTLMEMLVKDTPKDDMDVLQIILLILTVISLLALCLTFITYCLFKQLRTLPGQNNMSLVVSMFIAMVFLQFGLKQTTPETLCASLGILIHYFWLCMFFCLNICSFHMYNTFRSKTGYHSNGHRKRLLRYLLYSYGTPTLIVIVNIIFNVSLTPSYGYGGSICFISEKLSSILTFIVPVTMICLSNLFFYSGTAVSIAKTPKIESDETFKRNEIHFSIYIKLFILTGGSWIIQIIDSFLPISAFTVIVSIINSIQGIYIFIAFICNKRVYLLYRNTLTHVKGRRQTLRSKTYSSTETTKMSLSLKVKDHCDTSTDHITHCVKNDKKNKT